MIWGAGMERWDTRAKPNARGKVETLTGGGVLTDAQLAFDFYELQDIQNENEKPKPALPHFDEPQNDNERLLNYQWEYRERGDARALKKMYSLGYTVAMKYIETKAKGNRHVKGLCWSDKEEKAHNAIAYILTRYGTHREWYIKKSVTGYIYLRVKFELYYQTKADKIVRFLDGEKINRVIDRYSKNEQWEYHERF